MWDRFPAGCTGFVRTERKEIMTTIVPEGENIRRALRWIEEERSLMQDKGIGQFLDEAGRRFNLSPQEVEYLSRFLKTGK